AVAAFQGGVLVAVHGEQVVAVAGYDDTFNCVEGGGDVGVGVEDVGRGGGQDVCRDIHRDVIAFIACDVDDQHLGSSIARGNDLTVVSAVPGADCGRTGASFQAKNGKDGSLSRLADGRVDGQRGVDVSRCRWCIVLHVDSCRGQARSITKVNCVDTRRKTGGLWPCRMPGAQSTPKSVGSGVRAANATFRGSRGAACCNDSAYAGCPI